MPPKKKMPVRLRKLFVENMPPELREMFVEFGRRGGKIGGKKRWAGVSAAERREYARKIASRPRPRKNKDEG